MRRNLLEALESRRLLSSTWYVDANATGSTHDGTTWDTAYLQIQQALSSAVAGDEIRVADGEYIATSTSRINLKRDVSVFGGFAGSGAADPDARNLAENVSLISGLGGSGDGVVNAKETYDSVVIFDGFSLKSNSFGGVSMYITNSSATIRQCTFTGGMGIQNVNSSPTIQNCIFDECDNGYSGGGISNFSSRAMIADCQFINCHGNGGGAIRNQGQSALGQTVVSRSTFTGNHAAHEGQVIWNYDASVTFVDCLFSKNAYLYDPDRMIYNFRASQLTLSGCTFIDNVGVGSGGIIYSTAKLPVTLNDCVFIRNRSDYYGGGIYVTGGSSLSVTGCIFQDNYAYGYGGAIYADSPEVRIANSVFSGNEVSHGGGAVYLANGAATITNCSFSGNTVTDVGGPGGAIYSTATLTLRDTTFRANQAGEGGALFIAGGSLSATECTFSENSATSGGAIHAGASSGTPILTKCSFTGNTAQYGGGMYNYGNSPRLTGCTFTRNRAPQFIGNSSGGALHNNNAALSVADCAFFGNSAYDGGAVANISGTASTFVNTVFVGNFTVGSSGWGGAIYLWNGTTPVTTIINCTFASNSANRGGAITRAIPSGPMNLINSILWGNAAATGANIYNPASSPVVYLNLNSADPQFLRAPIKGADNAWGTPDDDYGDLRLQLDSPCIDAGDTASVPIGISTDVAGGPRIVDVPGVNDPGNIVDIGAYEYQTPLALSVGAFAYDAPHPTIALTFNGDVDAATLAVGDLTLFDPVTHLPIAGLPSASVAYDAGTRTAKWIFSSPLPDGNYRAKIAAGSVADAHGYLLSADFTFEFFVLAADANRDRVVNLSDLIILATNWQCTGRSFCQGDFNYDGVVNASDLAILGQKWQTKLDAPPPPGAPIPTAAKRMAARTPTRVASGIL